MRLRWRAIALVLTLLPVVGCTALGSASAIPSTGQDVSSPAIAMSPTIATQTPKASPTPIASATTTSLPIPTASPTAGASLGVRPTAGSSAQLPVEIRVELFDGADSEPVEALRVEVAHLPGVVGATFVSKEEALAELRAAYEDQGYTNLVQQATSNPVPAYLRIVVKDGDAFDPVRAALVGQPRLVAKIDIRGVAGAAFNTDLPQAGLGVSADEILAALSDSVSARDCTFWPSSARDDHESLRVTCGPGSFVLTLDGTKEKGLADVRSVALTVERTPGELVARQAFLLSTVDVSAPRAAKVWLQALLDAGPQQIIFDDQSLILGERLFGGVRVLFSTPLSAPESYEYEMLWIRGVPG